MFSPSYSLIEDMTDAPFEVGLWAHIALLGRLIAELAEDAEALDRPAPYDATEWERKYRAKVAAMRNRHGLSTDDVLHVLGAAVAQMTKMVCEFNDMVATQSKQTRL